jgi:hypothetical protein
MIGTHRGKSSENGDEGGPVAERGWIDVIESRAGIPERLLLWVRPVLHEEAGVGSKRTLNGSPFVQVRGSEERAHKSRDNRKYE